MTPTAAVDVRRSGHGCGPTRAESLARLFMPGQEGAHRRRVPGRLGHRPGARARRRRGAATLAEVVAAFADRHADLDATLDEHFALVAHRIEHPAELSTAAAGSVGAYFTQEYAVEAAALCNPSIVPHPDQSGLAPGELAS